MSRFITGPSGFADPDYGEWYGYLHRDRRLSVPLKGNLWKGFLHHPPALRYAARLAEEGFEV